VNYPVGSYPLSLVVKDLNGDGYPDLALEAGGNGIVMLDNGNGSFQAPIAYQLAAVLTPWRRIFNGDGKPDLAVVNENCSVSILLNTTSAQFPQAPLKVNVTSPAQYGSTETLSTTGGAARARSAIAQGYPPLAP
jgi:hypothetical protein